MNAGQMRIGDAEREAAAHDLGEHYVHGRINADEHAERLDHIWAARTAADLTRVFVDLPRLRSEGGVVPHGQQPRTDRMGPRRWAASIGAAMRPVPFLFKVLLAIVLVVLVVSHLPLLVVALLFYVFCLRRMGHRRYHHPRWR